ncbi:MAG: ABC transporter permease [bacterium]
MRVIGTIIVKEIRELLTRRMLLPFVAIMVLFLFIGRAIRGEKKRASAPQPVLVLIKDSSSVADTIISRLENSGLVITRTDVPKERALKIAQEENFSALLVFPESIAQRLMRAEPVTVEVYTILKGFSFAKTIRSVKVKSTIAQINTELSKKLLQNLIPALPSENIQNPLKTGEYVVLKGRTAKGSPEMVQGLIISQTFLIPIVLLMVIIYASQMIAASIGQEKENKTLETLLTVPINRVSIVIGKMLGAAVAAVVISAIFMAAMAYYATALSEPAGQTAFSAEKNVNFSLLYELGLNFTPEALTLIGLTLFLAILAALALATLLAVFAEDAKSAQTAITPLMLFCLIPYFFTMLFDVNTLSLPLKILLFAIPFSYPFLTPQALIFGNYPLILSGIGYMALFSASAIIITARIFATDYLLTARLRLWRRRR